MDWSNERYVRLYCRDTVEWEMLPWEARALWPNLLRKVDRAGILPLGRHGVKGLAALVKLPVEVVEPGLAALLEDGCLVAKGDVLVVPNFLAAQEAKQSDRQRQEESRARRRASALSVTDGHESSQPVTNRDDESQNVTECHDRSHAVTIGHSSLAVPCLAVPSRTEDPPLPPTADAAGGTPPPQLALVADEDPEQVTPERLAERWNRDVADGKPKGSVRLPLGKVRRKAELRIKARPKWPDWDPVLAYARRLRVEADCTWLDFAWLVEADDRADRILGGKYDFKLGTGKRDVRTGYVPYGPDDDAKFGAGGDITHEF